MEKYIYIIFVLALIFNGCKDEDNILIPIDSDAELQKQLIGTWNSQNNSHTVTYYSNSKFIDSMFSYSDGVRYNLYFIAEGNYTVKDSILIKSNILVRYIDSASFSLGFYYLFSSKYLKFSNNSFTEYHVDVFEPTAENSDELWGNWSTIVWTYRLEYSESSYLGRIKSIWNFDKSLNKATSWNEYLDRTNNATLDTFYYNNISYNPPILDLSGWGDALIEVKFKGDKMFWWYNYEPYSFYRK